MARACVLLIAFAATSVQAADEKPVVKELSTQDLKLKPVRGGKATEPAVIGSAEELEKSPVVGDAAEELKKQIDFAKEKLLVFAWAGSGQDKVEVKAEVKDMKTALKLVYTPGLTRDLRMHVKLFVVPKNAELSSPK